jgi:hypothetical protein
VFGEIAFRDFDLAASANRTPTADRIDIDTQAARGL